MMGLKCKYIGLMLKRLSIDVHVIGNVLVQKYEVKVKGQGQKPTFIRPMEPNKKNYHVKLHQNLASSFNVVYR